MDERVMQFRVGVIVFATLIIAMTLVLVFSDTESGGWFGEEYTVRMKFPQAPGVAERTPVRLSGVLIGRVKSVKLLEDGVLVETSISDKFKIRTDDRARIGGGSLLGDSVITIVRSMKREAPVTYVTDGGEIEGDAAPSLFEVVDQMQGRFNALSISLTQTSDDIGGLARDARGVVVNNEERLKELLEATTQSVEKIGAAANNVGATAERMSKTVEELNKVVADESFQGNIKRSAEQLPLLFEEARGVVSNVKSTMESADRNFRSLEAFTKALGERGGPVLENADKLFSQLGNSSGKLDQLLENFVVFSDALNRQDSSVGRLLNDRELYDNVNDLVENLNRITYEVRPVIRDARLFADKLARHPESLGVAGALQGRKSGAKPVVFSSGSQTSKSGGLFSGLGFGGGNSGNNTYQESNTYCPPNSGYDDSYFPTSSARPGVRTASASSSVRDATANATAMRSSTPSATQPAHTPSYPAATRTTSTAWETAHQRADYQEPSASEYTPPSQPRLTYSRAGASYVQPPQSASSMNSSSSSPSRYPYR